MKRTLALLTVALIRQAENCAFNGVIAWLAWNAVVPALWSAAPHLTLWQSVLLVVTLRALIPTDGAEIVKVTL